MTPGPKDALIIYNTAGGEFVLTKEDFKKVDEYCENECMGVKFLINANFLRELVSLMESSGEEPPFKNEHFSSEKLRAALAAAGLIDSMEQKFGIDDVPLVSKIIIKSTYNFLHKI